MKIQAQQQSKPKYPALIKVAAATAVTAAVLAASSCQQQQQQGGVCPYPVDDTISVQK